MTKQTKLPKGIERVKRANGDRYAITLYDSRLPRGRQKKTLASIADCVSWKKRRLAELELEINYDPSNASEYPVNRVIDEYARNVVDYKYVKGSTAHKSALSKLEVVKRMCVGKTVSDMTDESIAAYIRARLRGVPTTKLANGVSLMPLGAVKWATIRKDLDVISKALLYAKGKLKLNADTSAVHNGKILFDFDAKGVRREEVARDRRCDREESRILDELDNTMGVIARLAIELAARRGEIFDLKVGNYDRDNRLLTIVRDASFMKTKTGIKGRTIPLSDKAISLLDELVKGKHATDRVFSRYSAPEQITKLWTRWRTKLTQIRPSFHDLRFHDFRHEGASRLFAKGLTIEQVASITGHSKWETLKIYTQLRPEDIAHKVAPSVEEAQAIEAAIRQSAHLVTVGVCPDGEARSYEAVLSEAEDRLGAKAA